LALSRFAAPRPSFWFVLYINKTGDWRVFHEEDYSKMTLRTSRKKLGCLTLRSNALLSAFSVILTRVFISRDFGNYYERHSFTPRA
jgi:hypothetical protein